MGTEVPISIGSRCRPHGPVGDPARSFVLELEDDAPASRLAIAEESANQLLGTGLLGRTQVDNENVRGISFEDAGGESQGSHGQRPKGSHDALIDEKLNLLLADDRGRLELVVDDHMSSAGEIREVLAASRGHDFDAVFAVVKLVELGEDRVLER